MVEKGEWLSLSMAVGEQDGGLPVEWIGSTNGSCFHASSGHNAPVTKLIADGVECSVEGQTLFSIVKEIQLVAPTDQMAESNANQPNTHAAVIKLLKQFQGPRNQFVIGSGIGHLGLRRSGVEIGVPDFDGDASGEFLSTPQLIGQVFRHGRENAL